LWLFKRNQSDLPIDLSLIQAVVANQVGGTTSTQVDSGFRNQKKNI
jgi:hypothetical protein